jgi:hypothetical protein
MMQDVCLSGVGSCSTVAGQRMITPCHVANSSLLSCMRSSCQPDCRKPSFLWKPSFFEEQLQLQVTAPAKGSVQEPASTQCRQDK